MKLVLLSGGSGKRLWPLSNDARSKQFLKVLDNGNGEQESMVQRVWRQITASGLGKSAVIATGGGQLDMIQSQLGNDVPVVVEPERRDTFPAIALAASYLHSVQAVDPGEAVVVMPVDPYVEVNFFEVVKQLEGVLQVSGAELALIGVKPTYPSEKYGYIVPDKPSETGFIKVSHFAEKPSERQARELIAMNALWNCGVFAFRLGHILALLQDKGFPVEHKELLRNYGKLPKISFDYEVVEKAGNIVAVQYDGSWKDLGTWNTLTEEIANQVIGNGIVSGDCSNTHVINELDIPVTVLGLSNIVVAASPDGLLVTDKAASPRVKELVADFQNRLMYEERRWGWYRVLDFTKFQDYEVLTKRICIQAGKNLSYQVHHKRKEVWTIISGEGEVAFDGVIYPVKPGDVLQLPVGAKHAIKADTDLQFIEVQTGSQLVEEDIVRLCMTWEEICAVCRVAESEIAAAKLF